MLISNFQVGVKAIIIQSEHILLIREHHKEKWDVPGGRLEDQETLLEGLKRELREELGCQKPVIGPLLYADRIPSEQMAVAGELVLLFYKVELPDIYVTKQVILPHPTGVWFSLKEVESLPLQHLNLMPILRMTMAET